MAGKYTRVPTAEQLATEREVLRLRQAGYTFAEITERTDLKSAGHAHTVYKRAMARVAAPNAGELRELQGSRIEALLKAMWDTALAGDVQAMAQVRGLLEQYSKLWGLNHADGIAEWQMRLNEAMAGMVVGVLARVLDQLQLTDEQQAIADRAVPAELRAVQLEEPA